MVDGTIDKEFQAHCEFTSINAFSFEGIDKNYNEIKKNSELSPHQVATHSDHPNLYQFVSEKLGKFNPILSKKLNWTAFHKPPCSFQIANSMISARC